jgi:hypothetical protein
MAARAFCDAPEDDPIAIMKIVDAKILKKNQTGRYKDGSSMILSVVL